MLKSPAPLPALVGGWIGSQRGGPLASTSSERNPVSSLVATVDEKQ